MTAGLQYGRGTSFQCLSDDATNHAECKVHSINDLRQGRRSRGNWGDLLTLKVLATIPCFPEFFAGLRGFCEAVRQDTPNCRLPRLRAGGSQKPVLHAEKALDLYFHMLAPLLGCL